MFKPTLASVTKNLTKTVDNLGKLAAERRNEASICADLAVEAQRQCDEANAVADKADKIAANIASLLEVE